MPVTHSACSPVCMLCKEMVDKVECIAAWYLFSLVFLEHKIYASTIGCGPRDWKANSASNLTLTVSASVTDSTITLNCSSLDSPLTADQYLRWTEKGRPDLDLMCRYSITSSTNHRLEMTIINASYLDYGVYTCRCYNNITGISVTEVQDLYYHSDWEFFPHCSEPFSVKAAKSDIFVISDHKVNSINSEVQINCSSEQMKLLNASGNNIENISFPFTITVDSPSKQGKYICIDKDKSLKEIHYVFIPGYQPLKFLIPTESNSVLNELYSVSGNVPVCTVYSSVPVTALSMRSVIKGNYYLIENIFQPQQRNFGLYYLTYSGALLNQISHYSISCFIETIWEEKDIQFKINIITTDPMPSICLTIFIDPPIKTITVGSNFTVYCSVSSSSTFEDILIKILHVNDNGTETKLPVALHAWLGHDYYVYHTVVNNATENNKGIFICQFSWNSWKWEKSTEIERIVKESSVHGLFSTSSSLHIKYTSHIKDLSTSSLSSIASFREGSVSYTMIPFDTSLSGSDNFMIVLFTVSGALIALIFITVLTIMAVFYFIYRKRQKEITELTGTIKYTRSKATPNDYVVVF